MRAKGSLREINMARTIGSKNTMSIEARAYLYYIEHVDDMISYESFLELIPEEIEKGKQRGCETQTWVRALVALKNGTMTFTEAKALKKWAIENKIDGAKSIMVRQLIYDPTYVIKVKEMLGC